MLNNSIGYFIITKLKLQLNHILHICNLYMSLRVKIVPTIVLNYYELPIFCLLLREIYGLG